MKMVMTISFNIDNHVKAEAKESSDNKKKKICNGNGNVSISVFDRYSSQFKAVEKYVERAEQLKTGEAIYLAELLVEKLPNDERQPLLKRLHQIRPKTLVNTPDSIEKAMKEVTLAESDIHDEAQLKKAQELVTKLYISPERTNLVERLYQIHQKLREEKENQTK